MPNGYIGQIHIDQTDYKIGSTLFAVLDTDESIGSITTIDSITTFTQMELLFGKLIVLLVLLMKAKNI